MLKLVFSALHWGSAGVSIGVNGFVAEGNFVIHLFLFRLLCNFAANDKREVDMIVFPCAKINLGLNVVSKRDDGYHNIETVFFPVPLCDILEVEIPKGKISSAPSCELTVGGHTLAGDIQQNLVVKAYRLLAADYTLPPVRARLHKRIPSQAGLGGGSSDAAFMIRLLNDLCQLHLTVEEMQNHAARLGADCAFFITARPTFATGIGDILEPFDAPSHMLRGCYLAIIKPDIAVSTAEAYRQIMPVRPSVCCKDILREPVEAWKDVLTNDFEKPAFHAHPALKVMKDRLYCLGASYAQMSGSGSAMFGIFREAPSELQLAFPESITALMRI